MSIFNVEIFLGDLNINLNEDELNHRIPVNDYYEKFYNTFKEVIDQFATLRKATRKEKELHTKLWLTRGLLKSIDHKNNLFKKLYKNYNKKLLKNYKNYRNLLNRTINRPTAKKHYYMYVITENKTNQINLWKVINEIGSFKTKTRSILNELRTNNGLTKDPEIICNTLNNFFINVGKNLANSIEQVVMKSALSSKQSQINNSFFFAPAVRKKLF